MFFKNVIKQWYKQFRNWYGSLSLTRMSVAYYENWHGNPRSIWMVQKKYSNYCKHGKRLVENDLSEGLDNKEWSLFVTTVSQWYLVCIIAKSAVLNTTLEASPCSPWSNMKVIALGSRFPKEHHFAASGFPLSVFFLKMAAFWGKGRLFDLWIGLAECLRRLPVDIKWQKDLKIGDWAVKLK